MAGASPIRDYGDGLSIAKESVYGQSSGVLDPGRRPPAGRCRCGLFGLAPGGSIGRVARVAGRRIQPSRPSRASDAGRSQPGERAQRSSQAGLASTPRSPQVPIHRTRSDCRKPLGGPIGTGTEGGSYRCSEGDSGRVGGRFGAAFPKSRGVGSAGPSARGAVGSGVGWDGPKQTNDARWYC